MVGSTQRHVENKCIVSEFDGVSHSNITVHSTFPDSTGKQHRHQSIGSPTGALHFYTLCAVLDYVDVVANVFGKLRYQMIGVAVDMVISKYIEMHA